MEDFGQIVAIIIGIIVVAVNAATKKKKPNKGKPTPASPPPVQKNKTGIPAIDEILEQLEKNIQAEKAETTLPEVEMENASEYESFENIDPIVKNEFNEELNHNYSKYSSTNHVEEKVEIVEKSTPSIENEPIKEKTDNSFPQFIEENIVNAVLFSEVFNRPKY